MIIPIGHESSTVRRMPWISFAIMAICLVAHISISLSGDGGGDATQRLEEAAEYWFLHPYLELDSRLRQALFQGQSQDEVEAMIEAQRQHVDRPDEQQIEEEQLTLDSLTEAAFGAVEEMPLFTWGLIPSKLSLVTLVSHMFVHGGWMHLLGNLMMLYLCGPFIEDVWGRPIFAGFYLLAGVVASLMFVLHYPHLEGPLIGASGAIAGVMGAFLVRYARTKITFFYWFGIFFRGTFRAPAWLMIPLWFLRELLFAQAMDVVLPESGGGGVAYWAHVWGFAFGVVVALAIGHFKVEQRYLHSAIEAKITLVDNPGLDRALAARAEGRTDEAMQLLEEEVRRSPDNIDTVTAYWSLAADLGTPERAAPTLVRLLRNMVRRSTDTDEALQLWQELLARAPDFPAEPGLALRITELLAAVHRHDEADEALTKAFAGVTAATPAGLLVRLARAARDRQVPWAAEAVHRALAHPELPPDLRDELAAIAGEPGMAAPGARAAAAGPVPQQVPTAATPLPSNPPPPPSPAPSRAPSPAPVPPPAALRVMECIPLKAEGGCLHLQVGKEVRQLPISNLQGIAAAGIAAAGQQPYLVIDLLLDLPQERPAEVRVVRIRSTTFDPRRLITGVNDSKQAFQVLLDQLLRASGAVALPDLASVRGRPFRVFASLEQYRSQVLA